MAFKVEHIPSGTIIEVYKHKERSTYVNADDCNTEYKKEDIRIWKKQ